MLKEIKGNSKHKYLLHFYFKLPLEDLGLPRTFANFVRFPHEVRAFCSTIIHIANFSVVYKKFFINQVCI